MDISRYCAMRSLRVLPWQFFLLYCFLHASFFFLTSMFCFKNQLFRYRNVSKSIFCEHTFLIPNVGTQNILHKMGKVHFYCDFFRSPFLIRSRRSWTIEACSTLLFCFPFGQISFRPCFKFILFLILQLYQCFAVLFYVFNVLCFHCFLSSRYKTTTLRICDCDMANKQKK